MAAPAAPAAAPFFLPTVPGLTPRFATQTQTEHETQVTYAWDPLTSGHEYVLVQTEDVHFNHV